MSALVSQKKRNTHWMSKAAGIINFVVSGGIIAYSLWTMIEAYQSIQIEPDDPGILFGVIMLIGCIGPVLSGILCLQRKHWLGAVILAFLMFPATILSIILLGLSNKEFQ